MVNKTDSEGRQDSPWQVTPLGRCRTRRTSESARNPDRVDQRIRKEHSIRQGSVYTGAVAGFDFLRDRQKLADQIHTPDDASSELVTFAMELPKHGISAEARGIDGEFVVLTGSQARGKWVSNSQPHKL